MLILFFVFAAKPVVAKKKAVDVGWLELGFKNDLVGQYATAAYQINSPPHLIMAETKKKSRKEAKRELRMLEKEISGGKSLIDYGKVNQVSLTSSCLSPHVPIRYFVIFEMGVLDCLALNFEFFQGVAAHAISPCSKLTSSLRLVLRSTASRVCEYVMKLLKG